MNWPPIDGSSFAVANGHDGMGLCRWHECRGCASEWDGKPRDEIVRLLSKWICNPTAMAELRLIATDGADEYLIALDDDHEAIDRVAALIETGRLRVCGQRAGNGGGGGGGGSAPKPAPAPVPPPGPSPQPRPVVPPGDLIVHVRSVTATGDPIEAAHVAISGTSSGSGSTNAADTVSFLQIKPGGYNVTAGKDHHTPEPASATATVTSGGVTHVTLVLKPDIVTQIKAKVAGTHGVRKPATDTRATNVLKSSSSSDESLSGNPPVILVRGCHSVELEAVTNRPDLPVSWTVVPNENTDAPPTITPKAGGRKATLKTNVHGSFSVIATLNASKVVWNVVFVWVKVDVSSTVVTTRNLFASSGASATNCRFRSGQFSAGNYAWEVQVNVKVVGGGASKRLGTDKVKLHVLQNGVADTLTGHYAPPPAVATALEVPIGGMPIVDSNDATQPFIYLASSASVTPNNTAFERVVWTGDSPAGSFPLNHQNTATRLQTISGINGFVAAVAAVSDDARNSIVAHAKLSWNADYSGAVDAAGIYTKTTAAVASDAQFALVSAGTGGKDAGDAGLETFQPRFNQGTNTTWTP